MGGENGFDSSRAELFEALGHPTRVKILRSLQRGALGFSELKKEVGIESSGHLQFHLSKLGNLVGTDPNGSYSLTDEGREALRVLGMARVGEGEPSHWKRPILGLGVQPKVILATLLILLVVMASVIVYQQDEIASLNGIVSSNTVMIGGARYYYESVPAFEDNGTRITFHGVLFTFFEVPNCYSNPANFTFACTVRLSNGTVLNLVGKNVDLALSGWVWPAITNQTTQEGSGVPFTSGREPLSSPTQVAFAKRPMDSMSLRSTEVPQASCSHIPSLVLLRTLGSESTKIRRLESTGTTRATI
jgi:DNA-binding transcriptional ArsR family regulator